MKSRNVYRINGQALKNFLVYRRISQANFAQYCEMTQAMVSGFVNNRSDPGKRTATKMIAVLSTLDCPQSTLVKIFPTLGAITRGPAKPKTTGPKEDIDLFDTDDFLDDEDMDI